MTIMEDFADRREHYWRLDTVTTDMYFTGKSLRSLLGQAKQTNSGAIYQVATKFNTMLDSG